jgi:hypothetical protein
MIALIKKQDRVNNVPLRWEQTYENKEYGGDKLYILTKLNELQKPLNAEVVNDIIGNDSWTSFQCHVCDKEVETLIYFKPNIYDRYDNPGISMCGKCITEASDLLKDK